MPFTKSFRKIRLESKWVVSVGSFRWKICATNGSLKKKAVFTVVMSQTEIRVPFLRSHF